MEMNIQSRHWTTNYEVIPTASNKLSDSCAKCSTCGKSLVGKETFEQEKRVFCWQCLKNNYACTCFSCSKIIIGDSTVPLISYSNQRWHPDCFRCSFCKKSLVNGNPTIRGTHLYCWRCQDKEKYLIG